MSLQDDNKTPPKVLNLKKPKEKSLEASLFDDNVDIFADLTPPTKPKEKKAKKKVETKSIFDDDMGKFLLLEDNKTITNRHMHYQIDVHYITFLLFTDDIFSSGITKPVGASTAKKSKKPVQENNSAEESGHSIFDDPLNVLGGN